MQEKYGFVYIWYDRKHKRFYIGCRWGSEDDGYICSSKWMRQGYKRRPEDFKRRILERVYSSRQDLLEREHKWISLIDENQLGKRYYNLRKHHFSHWATDEIIKLKVVNKIKNSWGDENKEKLRKLNTGKKHSEDTKQKIREKNTGKKHSEDTKQKISESKIGIPRSEHTKRKISKGNKGKKRPDGYRTGTSHPMFGKRFSEQARLNMKVPRKRKIVKCPHCEKVGNQSPMTRYHFENCKHK